jgi:hypothetical protein
MKAVADSRGRLAAMEYFKPGKAYDLAPLPDGGVRVVELVEREVPVVKVKFKKDGSFVCQRIMTREEIVASIRADRDSGI